jgi:hypothetical protein
MWPPNSARGCAAGARVRPNRNTAEPPIEARKSDAEGGSTYCRTSVSPNAAPAADDRSRNTTRANSPNPWRRSDGLNISYFDTAQVSARDTRPSGSQQHGVDDSARWRWRLERVELLWTRHLYVPNLWRSRYLPVGIVALQLRYLHLVPGADPPPCERVAEAEGVEHERGHAAILARWTRYHQYNGLWPRGPARTRPE